MFVITQKVFASLFLALYFLELQFFSWVINAPDDTVKVISKRDTDAGDGRGLIFLYCPKPDGNKLQSCPIT